MGLVLDSAITVLLAVVVGYSIVLNRRLGELRKRHGEFVGLVDAFKAATERAEAGAGRLRAGGEHTGLDGQIDAARELLDDLSLMVKRGNRLADRLGPLTGARSGVIGDRPIPGPAITSLGESGGGDGTHGDSSADSRATLEHNLLKALRAARGG